MDDYPSIRDMVISHDKVLDSLSESIRTLATTASNTNVKLDKVVDKLSEQNVLIERMNNMDKDLNESFNRVYGRLDKIESAKDGDGCNALKAQNSALTDVNLRLRRIDTKVEAIDKEFPEKVSWSAVKWFTGLTFGSFILFNVYIVTSIQDLETHNASHESDNTTTKEAVHDLHERVKANEDLHIRMGVTMDNVK